LLPFKSYWLCDAQTGLTINNCTPCPHCIYVFCIYLSTNSDLCHLHHKMIGFYNQDKNCLLRGTDWGFKESSLRFVFKGLKFIISVRGGHCDYSTREPKDMVTLLQTISVLCWNLFIMWGMFMYTTFRGDWLPLKCYFFF